jgi:hypothetical protein
VYVHGASSRSHPKPSFRVEFLPSEGVAVPLFGRRAKTLYLKACWLDVTCMREYLLARLLTQGGGLAPETVHASLSIGDKYMGLYLVVEAIDDVFMKRVGLDLSAKTSVVLEGFSHEANWDASKVSPRVPRARSVQCRCCPKAIGPICSITRSMRRFQPSSTCSAPCRTPSPA